MKHKAIFMSKYFLLAAMGMLFFHTGFAQTSSPEMADVMRSNGKIYIVVLVLATIFAGLIIYLIRLDKKISRLEKSK